MKVWRGRSGNVVTILLAGAAMAGTLSYILYQTIAGPMASMARVTRSTASQAIMLSASQGVVLASVNQSATGDCDSDGFIEPPEWRDAASSAMAPSGGGLLPTTISTTLTDPWGTDYGYCVWDVGTSDAAACGGASQDRLQGSTAPLSNAAVSQTAFAVISAGPDRQFSTTCSDFNGGTPNADLINTSGDDTVMRYSYIEASAMGNDLWRLQPGDPSTAEIQKDLTISSSHISAMAVTTQNEIVATGGLQVADQNKVQTCDLANEGLLRYHTGSATSGEITISGVTPLTRETDGTTTSATATFLSSDLPTAGETVTVMIAGDATGGNFSVSSVTDNQGNTYTQSGTANAGTNSRVFLYSSANIGAVSDPFIVTVNYGGGSSRKVTMGAVAIDGLDVSGSVIDATGTVNDTAPVATSLTVPLSSPGTTSGQDNTIAIALHGYEDSNNDQNVNYSVEQGWTRLFTNQNASDYMGMSAAYKIIPDTGTAVTHTWSHDAHASGANTMALLATLDGSSATSGTASMEFCDGSAWQSMGSGGGGGGGGGAADIDALTDASTDYTNDNIGLGQNTLYTPAIAGEADLEVWDVSTPTTQTSYATSASLTIGYVGGSDGIIIVAVTGIAENGNFDIADIYDNHGNKYFPVAMSDYSNNGTSGGRAIIYAATIGGWNGSSHNITVVPTGPSMINMSGFAMIGGDFMTPADQIGQVTHDGGAASGSTTVSTAGSTIDTQELVVAVTLHDSGDSNVNFSTEGGWTSFMLDNNGTAGPASSAVYRMVTSTGSQSHTWTHDNQTNRAAAIATFRANPGSEGSGNLAVGHYALCCEFGGSEATLKNIRSVALGSATNAVAWTGSGGTNGIGNTAMGAESSFWGVDNIAGTSVGTWSSYGYFGANLGYNSAGGSDRYYNVGIGAETFGTYYANSGHHVAAGYRAAYNLHGQSSENIALGSYVMHNNSTRAKEVVAVGVDAMSDVRRGDGNVAIGRAAYAQFRRNNSSAGDGNVAVGYEAMNGDSGSAKTASNNVAIGYQAFFDNDSSTHSVAVGHEAMRQGLQSNDSVALGAFALRGFTNVGGGGNIAAGYGALTNLTNGYDNTLIGYQAGQIIDSGSLLTGIGSGIFTNSGSMGIEGNVAIGYQALYDYDSATGGNVAIGTSAGNGMTGSNNTAVGSQTMLNQSTLSTNGVAFGYNAGGQNPQESALFGTNAGTDLTFSSAVGFGYNAGTVMNASGWVAVGSNALATAVTGTDTTAFGYFALGLASPGGNSNSAFGGLALRNAGGDSNTAFGYEAMAYRTNAARNTAFGHGALATGTSGVDNVAFGHSALSVNTANENTAFGYYALNQNTSGTANVGVGSGALENNTIGNNNTAVGYYSIRNNVSGSSNTAIGEQALYDNSGNGDNNVAVGYYALTANDSGSNNTAVGYEALDNNTTGSNNVAIGREAGPTTSGLSNTISIGYGAQTTASNTARLGNASVTTIEGQVAWSPPSDRRIKKDIQDIDLGLDFVRRLKPVSYRLKKDDTLLHYGFIAQDIEDVLDGRVTNMITRDNDPDKTYHWRGDDLIAPIVKAVQERQKTIDARQKRIDALEALVHNLEKDL